MIVFELPTANLTCLSSFPGSISPSARGEKWAVSLGSSSCGARNWYHTHFSNDLYPCNTRDYPKKYCRPPACISKGIVGLIAVVGTIGVDLSEASPTHAIN
jgi:hypothetical protein